MLSHVAIKTYLKELYVIDNTVGFVISLQPSSSSYLYPIE